MWIRRTFANDTLYTTLVQSYIGQSVSRVRARHNNQLTDWPDTLLQGGFNFECNLGSSIASSSVLLTTNDRLC